MKSAGAQGLIFNAVGSIYADVARAMQTAGLQMPLASYATNAYDPVFLSNAGTAANGSVIVNYNEMYLGEDAGTNPTVALFDKWYHALYNTAPDEFAYWGWISGMLFVDGLNAGGGITRANLLSGLQKTTNFDAGGLVAPNNPPGKKPPSCYIIIDVINQKFLRDPVDPSTGYICPATPDYYYASNG
jgi:hypothetical protein